jgi:hypothetical protein
MSSKLKQFSSYVTCVALVGEYSKHLSKKMDASFLSMLVQESFLSSKRIRYHERAFLNRICSKTFEVDFMAVLCSGCWDRCGAQFWEFLTNSLKCAFS